MTKMTRLEAMRAARDQREEAILQPIIRERNALAREKDSLGRALASLQESFDAVSAIVTSNFGRRLVEELRERAAHDLQPKLYDLLSSEPEGEVTIKLSRRDLRYLRPSEAQQLILDLAERQISRTVRIHGRKDRISEASVIRITVPQFSIERAVANRNLRSPLSIG